MGSQSYATNAVTLTVEPSGRAEVLTAQLLHFSEIIGARPSEFQLELADLGPEDVVNSDYQGKACTLKVDGVLKCTGTILRIEKSLVRQSVVFTVLDWRHKINAHYIGETFLETLDTNASSPTYGTAVPTAGLAGYGADITFNKDGLPNRTLTGPPYEFVPPVYEHNTRNAAYWTFGQALQWLWDNCIEPTTGIAAPTVDGDEPEDWTFGGMDKKLDKFGPLLGMPQAECVDALLSKTRVSWYVAPDGTPKFFSIEKPTGTQTVDAPTFGSPIAPDSSDWIPVEWTVEESVDDAVGELKIVGGKQIREVTLIDTEFTQQPWFGIGGAAGWITNQFPYLVGQSIWSNYDVQRYTFVYGRLAEYVYRYNLNTDIFEAHRIGKNITATSQPYRMQSELLVARAKNGQFVNPDEESAISSATPDELLLEQYPDGAQIDFDRGYLLCRGVGPFNVLGFGPGAILPPTRSLVNPRHFTVAFECAYRAYQTVSNSISGLDYQIKRAIVRDELVHKTREATKILFPVKVSFSAGIYSVTEGVPMPTGWTRDYPLGGTTAVDRTDFTATAPAGVVVDGMGLLGEVKDLVSPYVGLKQINGTGAFPTWRDLPLGTKLTDASGVYGLTGNEVVIGAVFDGQTQRFDIGFTNRLGLDVTALAENFVDQRAYRRAL